MNKHLVILVLSCVLSFVSCFTPDRIPQVKLLIDSSLENRIKYICILDTETENLAFEDRCKEPESDKILFYEAGERFRISIKFKDSTEYTSNFIQVGDNDTFIISTQYGNIQIEPQNKSKFLNITLIALIAFILLWITRIPISLLIINPLDKKEFIISSTVFTILYFLIYIAFFQAFPVLLIIFYLALFFGDYLIYWRRDDSENLNCILASIFSNIVFIILGQYLIAIAIMILF